MDSSLSPRCHAVPERTLLELDLANAIEKEDYEEAARLRDLLRYWLLEVLVKCSVLVQDYSAWT